MHIRIYSYKCDKNTHQKAGITLGVKKLLNLSLAEKGRLKPLVEQLKNFEVYESINIEDLVKKPDTKNSKNIKQWKEKMDNAVYAMNGKI